MRKVFLFFHLFAFAAFVGSVFGHITLGIAFQPSSNMEGYANIVASKSVLTNTVIFSGLVVSVMSGLGLVWVRGIASVKEGWLIAKLGLVTLVILNAVFFLAPIGVERSMLSAQALTTSDLPERFTQLGLREDIFGTANLLFVFIIVALSLRKRIFSKRK